MSDELRKITIRSIQRGKPLILIDDAIDQIIYNLEDSRTDPYAKRKINVVMTFARDKNSKGTIDVEIVVKPVPAPLLSMGSAYKGVSDDGEESYGEIISEQMEFKDIMKEAEQDFLRVSKLRLVDFEEDENQKQAI